MRTSKLGWMFVLVVALFASRTGAVNPGSDSVPPFAYHLRIVRVSAEGVDPGAAVGWAPNGGAPVVLPSDEAWGTPSQLDRLAAVLGGAKSRAVTGFYVLADTRGVLKFDRRIYVGEHVLRLEFNAVPPASTRGAHEVGLVVSSATGDQKPLAEARVLLATDRTVAIAVPGAVAGDWMVLGVTPLEPSLAAKRVHESSGIPREGDGEVSMPKLLHRVTPDYPQGAKAERLTGKIVLMLLVDREGIPRAPAILDMTPGTEELAAAAVDAVLQWRYEPAKRRGEPVPIWFTVVIQFRLE